MRSSATNVSRGLRGLGRAALAGILLTCLGASERAEAEDSLRPSGSGSVRTAAGATGTVGAQDPLQTPNEESAQDPGRPPKKKKWPDVIYVPTPQPVVDAMLELAEVRQDDDLYDLGCGDGRIVVTAAKKYRTRGVGIDIDPKRVKESRENARKNGVADLVTIKQDDIFEVDLSEADVVTLYLLPELNVQLMPKLRRLKPGTRIVSHEFDMKGAKPRKTITIPAAENEDEDHTVYLWVVPWEDEAP